MEFDFSKQKLPSIYKRLERECYLDPIREKLIYITPEETVRQQVISYIINTLKVPANMIRVEESLLHYGVNSRGRVDILLHKYNKENDELNPLCVIECKAPQNMLDTNVLKQMVEYCDALCCDYGMITNGYEMFCYHYNNEHEEYEQIKNLPQYIGMVRGEYTEVPIEEPIPRLKHEKIPDNLDLYRGFDMGENTEEKILIPLINFWECLLEPKNKLPCKKYRLFTVIKDMHIRLLSYGNASGGSFQGVYRSFLIEYKGSTEIISMGISTYVSHAKPNHIKTAICVAIDNEKETHHALQFVADDNLYVYGNKVTFYHHGRIGVGNIGSGKIDELREFVAESYPEIIDGKRFNLGTLTDNHLWNLDEPDVEKVMENFISYALIRDEYRAYVKNRKSSAC